MNEETRATTKPAATPDRRQRLADELRENLKKRKALARMRAGKPDDGTPRDEPNA